ncbi:MAG: gluconate 2-dehydrogenase subunit 3 family protein [Bacteroidetes bacterium]|nr:gluconate 2-dehydrogenase subunit 3 family protein [Bacteroidota bacterium]
MDRRTALKNLALVIGSTALLPRCTSHSSVAHFNSFDVTYDQQSLVLDMAETIIPKTATPGATDLGLDKFIWLMLDDCTKTDDQKAFFKGMGEFSDLVKKTYNKDFADCTKQEKMALLSTFEKKPGDKKDAKPANNYSKELNGFFGTVKGLTVFGYTESQYFMTKEIVYELVPGRYNAMYPVKNNMKA